MKGISPKVSIVLLNYCNYIYTINCLDSLSGLQYDNYNIIVVDNNSPDESYRKLKELENEKIQVILSEINGGFAHGNNIAIDIALQNNSDYVLLLNNDTLVDPSFLNKMLEATCEEDGVGIVTSRIMYYPETDKIWYAGGCVDWNNLRAKHFSINEKYDEKEDIKRTNFASGCCMLIPCDVIRNVGKLPEEYFMYYEDLDFCVNVLEHGYEIRYVPEAVIYHCVSASGGGEDSPFVIEWVQRSRRLFLNKYAHYIPSFKRGVIFIKCEVRTIMKIMRQSDKKKKLWAYYKSFMCESDRSKV